MMLHGFKFGLLLQFAIGPVCILVYNNAVSRGLADSQRWGQRCYSRQDELLRITVDDRENPPLYPKTPERT
jgi:hypothetical protein